MGQPKNRGLRAITTYQTTLVHRRWLTEQIFEIDLSRQLGFSYLPGQKMRLANQKEGREYTPINAPDDPSLTFCIRLLPEGRFTPMLAAAEIGTVLQLSAATGFFTYQTQETPAVFMATGTGIAPFLAFVRSGVHGFCLLHGVRTEQELIYRQEMVKAAGAYIPCLSDAEEKGEFRQGHITGYLEEELEVKDYDFYLCGNADMIRDAFRIIDRKFRGSRVFVEPFF